MEIETLPENEDAERNLIGLTLLEKRIPGGARDLMTTDFYWPDYRAAWSAFLELSEDGREIEPLSTVEIIKRNGHTNFGLHELAQTTFGMVRVNEKVFVNKIKSAATRRYLVRELYSTIQGLTSGKESLSDLKRKINELEITSDNKAHFKPLAEILENEVKPALLDLHKGITRKISTGFAAIDNAIGGGLSLSDVLLVAGLPGSGKSALVLQVAVNIAKQNIPIAFLSGEMSNRENVMRLLSQYAKQINLNSLGHIYEDELEKYTKLADDLKCLPMFFDAKTYDLQTVSKGLRTLIESSGVKVLVIDYIQLLKLNRFEKSSRYERITECSQEVKRIAMEYEVAVIEVAQFNREGAKSGKPALHDLEGSSQLEKDISLCFIIDRDNQSNSINLRIAKGRNSGLCEIAGTFVGTTLNFEF